MYLHTTFAHNTPVVNWLIQRVFEDQWENGDPLVTFRLDKMEVVKGHMPTAYRGSHVALAMHMEAMPDISFTQAEGEEMMINFTARLDGKVVTSRAPLSSIVQIRDRSLKDGTIAEVFMAYNHGMAVAFMRKPRLPKNLHRHLLVQAMDQGEQIFPEDLEDEATSNVDLGMGIKVHLSDNVPANLVYSTEHVDRILGISPETPETEGETVLPREDSKASAVWNYQVTAGDPKRAIDYDALQAGLASGRVVDLQAWKKSKRK